MAAFAPRPGLPCVPPQARLRDGFLRHSPCVLPRPCREDRHGLGLLPRGWFTLFNRQLLSAVSIRRGRSQWPGLVVTCRKSRPSAPGDQKIGYRASDMGRFAGINRRVWDIAVIPGSAPEGQLSARHRTFEKTACSDRERARLADRRMSGSERRNWDSCRSRYVACQPTCGVRLAPLTGSFQRQQPFAFLMRGGSSRDNQS